MKGVCPRGRFEIFQECGWQLYDTKYKLALWHSSKRKAQENSAFAREYVRLHGDINFNSFPFTLDDPLEPVTEEE